MKVYAMIRKTGKLIGLYDSEDRAREAFTLWFESLTATKEGLFDKERKKAIERMSFIDMKVTGMELNSDEVLKEYLSK